MKNILFRNKKRGFLIFSIIFLVSLAMLFISYRVERNNMIEKLDLSVKSDILSYRNIFDDKIAGIASEVFIIEQLIVSNDALTLSGGETVFVSAESKDIIENGLLTWAQTKNVFDQIRIIDNNGMEILRVNYNNGSPSIVQEADLQDKSDRYYFTNSIGLDDNYLYFSKLDLNMENGVVEVVDGEYKPMLRLVTPIFSSNNEKLGILVINYLADDIFHTLEQLKLSESSQIEIINEDGYYLHAVEDEMEYGFMFDDALDETVDKYNTFDVLGHASTTIGQYSEGNTLYTVLSITENHLSDYVSDSIGANIRLVSESGDFIVFGKVEYNTLTEYRTMNDTYLILGLIGILVAFLIARLLDEIEAAKKDRMTTLEHLTRHDFLTGLPNRSYILDLIQQRIDAKRFFSLMFIDFDGFKKINDQFGHDVGDLALIEGSSRIANSIRQDDIVARVGGDEFIVLISGLTDKKELSKIAEAILEEFQKPFVFDHIETCMGASIGISINDGTNDVDDLIKAADKAMYQVKDKTKNGYQFFTK